MKAGLYDIKGNKKEDINLPKVFETLLREDIVMKCYESEKFENRQRYAPFDEAGKRHSASGTISHRRHAWKGQYGKGISRVPRKALWRRGVSFYWVGAEVSGTRGGRFSHPPKGVFAYRKINEKEKKLAMRIAIASSANEESIKKRYPKLEKIESAPIIVETLPKKTKELISLLKNVLKNNADLIMKKREIRPGKGKNRGRKYKSNAGILIVKGSKEEFNFKNFDVSDANKLKIMDFYPLGRIVLYTKSALGEIENVV